MGFAIIMYPNGSIETMRRVNPIASRDKTDLLVRIKRQKHWLLTLSSNVPYKMKTLHCYTDGGCSGQMSLNYYDRRMISVVTDQFGDVLIEEKDETGGSNNLAEILAIKYAINYAVKNLYEVVCITTDSRISKAWIEGWGQGGKLGKKLNNKEYLERILNEIKELSQKIEVFIRWQPRAGNLAGQYIENKFAL